MVPLAAHEIDLNYSYRGLGIMCRRAGDVHRVIVYEEDGSRGIGAAHRKLEDAEEKFRGLLDWRVQLAVLTILTVLIYWMLW